MANLLIEVGTEELPLASLDILYSELAKKMDAALKSARLGFESISAEATPRRIALWVTGLASRQEDHMLEFSGPAYQAAYDASGNPTKALEGFVKSKGASLQDVQIKETPKGKFISIQKKESGRPAAAVLPQIFSDTLCSLSFPKLMRWEAAGFRFPRPIRWVVALLDKQVIPVKLADVKAGRQSLGHRFLSQKAFSVLSADWLLYQKLLKKNRVILKLSEREGVIRKTLQGKYGLRKVDPELLHEVAQLVEEPFFIQGSFRKEYLDLPSEVLATVMKKHQKIFACYDAQGKMKNQFAAVLNGKRTGLPRIIADFENVLESRLKDARYFYQEDTKQTLESRVDQLDQIVYLGKLGTLKDKVHRLQKLSEFFAEVCGQGALKASLVRASKLCKADLLTKLVYEMPELQGIVGREYAKASGEKQEVADAVGTQYLPKNLADAYTDVTKQLNPAGAMLGILDRLDLLTGAFGLGLEPSGSQDPFALRRAGGVMVKLIRAFKCHFNLDALVEKNIQVYGSSLKMDAPALKGKLRQFLQDRVIFELQVSPGTRSYEIAQAVLKASFDDIADAFERYEVMSQLLQENAKLFIQAAKVVERTANILKGVKQDVGSVKADLLKEEMESKLFKAYGESHEKISSAVQKKSYKEATRLYADAFYDRLNDFFAKVMVNAEDAEIRRNRQALMKSIHGLYAPRVADLSLLSRLDM